MRSIFDSISIDCGSRTGRPEIWRNESILDEEYFRSVFLSQVSQFYYGANVDVWALGTGDLPRFQHIQAVNSPTSGKRERLPDKILLDSSLQVSVSIFQQGLRCAS